MDKKNIIKYSLIILVILLIIIFAIIFSVLKRGGELDNYEEEFPESEMILQVNEDIEEINQMNTFFMVEKIINGNIGTNNKFYVNKMYYQEANIDVSYRLYVWGECFDTANRNVRNDFYAIDFDSIEGKYKITQLKNNISEEDFKKIALAGQQAYLTTENITGEFFQNDVSEPEILKRYLDYYKILMLCNVEKAYSLIDNNYKTLKFENYDNYRNYINNNINELQKIELSKYQINYFDNITQYVAYLNNGKYFIFNEDEEKNVTILLDQYMVDLPQFKTKYKESEVRVKVALNINKFIMGLNDKNYNYSYSLLADSFKANYFKDLASFEQYVKNNFFDENEVEFSIFTEQGSYYIYSINIKDKNSENSKEMKIIMKLNEGTDFEMSFSEE